MTSLDDLLLRIPDVGQKILSFLPIRDLITCLRVSRIWWNFIVENVLHDPDLLKEARKEILSEKWMDGEIHEQKLDCELEMRADDWHDIRDFYVDNQDNVFIHVILTEKFRESRKDYFLFWLNSQGHSKGSIRLDQPVSDIKFAKDHCGRALLVIQFMVSSLDYQSRHVILRLLEDQNDIENHLEVDFLEPDDSYEKCGIVADDNENGQIYLLGRKPEYLNMISVFKIEFIDDEGASFEDEFCQIMIPENSKMSFFLRGSILICCSSQAGFVSAFNLKGSGQQLWSLNFRQFLVVLKEESLTSTYCGIYLMPQIPDHDDNGEVNENVLLSIHDLQSGRFVFEFELPSNSRGIPSAGAGFDKDFVVTPGVPDSEEIRQVIDSISITTKQRGRRDLRDLIRPWLGGDSSSIVTSVTSLVENRILALTLSKSNTRGHLVLVDLMAGKTRPMGSVRLFTTSECTALKRLKQTQKKFICQRISYDRSENELHLISVNCDEYDSLIP